MKRPARHSFRRRVRGWFLGLTILIFPGWAWPSWADETPTMITVLGAPGEEDYSARFLSQLDRWKAVATESQARFVAMGADPTPKTNDLTSLGEVLKSEPRDGTGPLWLILIGHGTFDGHEARFNLRGPDLSASQLAAWLQPFRRTVIVIDTTAGSAPFITALSATNRVVISATRSGNELNFARFGQYLTESLSNPTAHSSRSHSFSGSPAC